MPVMAGFISKPVEKYKIEARTTNRSRIKTREVKRDKGAEEFYRS